MHLAGALFAAQKPKTNHQAMDGTSASVLNRGSCCQDNERQNRSTSPTVTEPAEIADADPSVEQSNPEETATPQRTVVSSPSKLTPKNLLQLKQTSQESTETSFAEQDLTNEFKASKSCPRCPASFRADEEPLHAFPVRPLVVSSKRSSKCNASETLDIPVISSLQTTLLSNGHDEDEEGGLMAPTLVVPTTTPVESVGPPLGRTSSAPSQMR